MKKLFMVLGFLVLLLSSLSARNIFDGKIIFTSHATAKDSLGYLIIEKAGGVLDTVTIIDTSGAMYWNHLYPFNETRYISRKPQALVSFVFDDGYDTDSSIMVPIFVAQGEVACPAITENLIGTGGRLTWSEVLYLQNLGWEILNHTTTHPNLNTITLDSVRTEFSICNDSALVHGITLRNVVYPGNNHSDSVRRVAREYFRGACEGGSAINLQVLETYALDRKCIDDSDSLSVYKTFVDRAESGKRWLIFYGHQTDADDADSIDALIDYIQAKNIPIVTINQGLDLVGNVFECADDVAVNESGIRLFGREDSSYALGRWAAQNITSGKENILFGYQSGYSITTGYRNVAIGWLPFVSCSIGYNNVAIGYGAMQNSRGNINVAIGYLALNNNVGTGANVAIGSQCLQGSGSGEKNVVIGSEALKVATSAHQNVALGWKAGYSNVGADYNTYIGTNAGYSNITGANNVFLGYQAGYNETGSNKLYIDNSDTTAPLIHGDFANNILTIHGELRDNDYVNFSGADSLTIPLWNNHPANAPVGAIGLDTTGTDTLWIKTQDGWGVISFGIP